MKKIKVYLQYPWKFPDSPYYKYLIDSPPENIQYLNTENQRGVITSSKKFFLSNYLKKSIRATLTFLRVSFPNAHLTKTDEDFDVIHCAHCLSKENKPHVVDFEGTWQLYVGEKTKIGKRKTRKYLLNKNCKKILPWTERAKNEIIREFPEVKDKVEVVFPAVPLNKSKIKSSKKINLLFIGRYFLGKGGMETLEVMDTLTKKYSNVEATIVSQVPPRIVERYSENKKIKFLSLVPQKYLFEKIYPEADIFIYPGYSDTFGFAFLEAMSFGIPIVTAEGFSRREIVGESQGFVVDTAVTSWNGEIPLFKDRQKMIDGLTEKTELLIKDKKLRNKMSASCSKEIKSGKFSIKTRNKALSKVYQNIVNSK